MAAVRASVGHHAARPRAVDESAELAAPARGDEAGAMRLGGGGEGEQLVPPTRLHAPLPSQELAMRAWVHAARPCHREHI